LGQDGQHGFILRLLCAQHALVASQASSWCTADAVLQGRDKVESSEGNAGFC